MQRRDFIRGFLVPTAAGTVALGQSAQAQSSAAPYFPQTPAEQSASPPVVPVSTQYPEGDIFRYFTQMQIDDVSHALGQKPVSAALNNAFRIPGITVVLRAGK